MDPNQIRFFQRSCTIGTLLGEAPLVGEPTAVTPEQMTALVEMVLVNGPMPELVFHERASEPDRVGRGAVFLAACRMFANGAPLANPRFVPEWAHLSLADLPPWCKRRFFSRRVQLLHIDLGTPDDVADAVMATLALA